MTQIGSCGSCGKPIVNKGLGWRHVGTSLAHCSDSIHSACAKPKEAMHKEAM